MVIAGDVERKTWSAVIEIRKQSTPISWNDESKLIANTSLLISGAIRYNKSYETVLVNTYP